MSNRRRALLAVFLLSPSVDHSQTLVVERIMLEGVAAFPEATVRHRLNLRPGVLPPKEEIEKAIERVLSYYEEHGYPFCSVKAPRIRSRAAERSAPGPPGDADPVAPQAPSGGGAPVPPPMPVGPAARSAAPSPSEPTGGVVAAAPESPLEQRSVPDTANSSVAIAVDLTFRIEEGPIVLIDSIAVEGNATTRRDVVTREFGLRTGGLYEQRRIDDGLRRLLRCGLFEAVDRPEVLYDTARERFLLRLVVHEGRTGRLDGIAGYAPGIAGGRGLMTGSVDLALGNLFGSARRLSVSWRRLSASSSDLVTGYREPWVVGTPVSLEAAIRSTERTGYTRRLAELTAEAPLSVRTTVRLVYGSSTVIPESSGPRPAESLPGRSNARRFGAGFAYDTRDDVLNPSEGTFLAGYAHFGNSRTFEPTVATSYAPSSRTASGPGFASDSAAASGRVGGDPASALAEAASPAAEAWSSAGIVRYEVHLEHAFTLLPRRVLLGAVNGWALAGYGGMVPLAEKVRLGGAASLRGYREEEFVGDRAVVATAEFRYLLSNRSRAFAFADAAQIQDRDPGRIGAGAPAPTRTRTSIRRFGYGAGVRLDSQAGIIGVDYGLGKGDRLTQGKLHVRLVNSF